MIGLIAVEKMGGLQYIEDIYNVFLGLFFVGIAVRIAVIASTMLSGSDDGKGIHKIVICLKAAIIVLAIHGLETGLDQIIKSYFIGSK